MATPKRTLPRPVDPIYRRLLADMNLAPSRKEARERRDEWAARGFKLSEARQIKQAKVAARKAEFWDERLKKLERPTD